LVSQTDLPGAHKLKALYRESFQEIHAKFVDTNKN
jgi:hypothetical protein